VIKYIKIGLLIIYVFFNAGMSYSYHFCGDVFQKVNFLGNEKSCCDSEIPVKGCCEDVSHLELPNSDQQISNLLDFQPEYSSFVFIPKSFDFSSITGTDLNVTFNTYNPPPKFNKLPIFIFHQSFLI